MRYLSSAWCAAAIIAVAGCSMNSGSSAGSSLPNTSSQQAMHDGSTDGSKWMPINSAGWSTQGPLPKRDRLSEPPAWTQRGGYYATMFRTRGDGVWGYSPKPNKDNDGPICQPPNPSYNVNGVASDEKGNLIVPGSSERGSNSTKTWNIAVYQGLAQGTTYDICGPSLGSIPDYTGQPVDAAVYGNAQIANIYVSQIDFASKKGEIVVCSLGTLTCGAPVTSSYITSYGAGVAVDAHGNCWLSTAKTTSSTSGPTGFRLIYWAGCTGNGVVASGASQTSYGGLFIDNAGNLASFDMRAAKLYVRSGCAPVCSAVAKYSLQGQSIYGGLNGSGHKLAAGDVANGSVDVYNYPQPTNGVPFGLRYSFSAGLKRLRIVETGIFSPSNARTH